MQDITPFVPELHFSLLRSYTFFEQRTPQVAVFVSSVDLTTLM